MTIQLVADSGANEVGSVGVKSLLDHEVDLPKVDVPQIDGDLFGICGLWSEFAYILRHPALHPFPIRVDGIWMFCSVFKGPPEKMSAPKGHNDPRASSGLVI